MSSKYSPEVISEALKLSDEIGNKAASEKLNINRRTIEYWRMLRNRENAKKTNKVIKPIEPEKELKNNPYITFEKQDTKEVNPKRGEIYYIFKGTTYGNEVASGRPAIIVSNDRLNEKASHVEIVFLTTQIKNLMPEHIIIKSTGINSTTIAEQITTVDKNRLGDYAGTCTPEEMKLLDKAILNSIGLEKYADNTIGDDQIVARISAIKAERDAYKDIYDKLFERFVAKK